MPWYHPWKCEVGYLSLFSGKKKEENPYLDSSVSLSSDHESSSSEQELITIEECLAIMDKQFDAEERVYEQEQRNKEEMKMIAERELDIKRMEAEKKRWPWWLFEWRCGNLDIAFPSCEPEKELVFSKLTLKEDDSPETIRRKERQKAFTDLYNNEAVALRFPAVYHDPARQLCIDKPRKPVRKDMAGYQKMKREALEKEGFRLKTEEKL